MDFHLTNSFHGMNYLVYIDGYLHLGILAGTPAILIKVSHDFPQTPTSKFQDSTLIRT
jgi:hypothetical protein